MTTAFITPYKIAFVDFESLEWVVIEQAVDVIFIIDIFVNFFSAYLNRDDDLITHRGRIAVHYLTSWFLIDFISVIPISIIIKSAGSFNSLARIARLPRLYRLLKITK
jgi:hypothetical protein